MRQEPEKQWRILRRIDDQVRSLAAALKIHPIAACVLLNRGLKTPAAAQAFLDPSPDGFHDPYLMQDMEPAVRRLCAAIERHEKVMIHGDYDVDGVAATAMMVRMLSALGVEVSHYIPHRLDEGYGVSEEGLRQAAREGVKLVITVDCGISAVKEAQLARELELDLIITDHHAPPASFERDRFSGAVAVLNPHRPDCEYPFPHLSGCGVAFKLASALVEELGHSSDALHRAYLDLVALATIADIVPLNDENRLIAKFGLERLSQTKKPGLKALKEVSGLATTELNTYHVGFLLAPRLNAAGRLDTAETALQLLLTRDEEEARQLAHELNRLNRERQEEEEAIFQDAELMIAAGQDGVGEPIMLDSDKAFVLASEDWHIGVVGIVASRLARRYWRPTILICLGEKEGKGSGRSIPAFHLKEGLDRCQEHLLRHGGHEQAAGLTLAREQLSRFRERFLQVAAEKLDADDLTPFVNIDCELTAEDLSFELVNELRRCEPYGQANPKPLFAIRGARLLDQAAIGSNGQHLKLRVEVGGRNYDAIWWQRGESFGEYARYQLLDLCCSLDVNEFQGFPALQLILEDVRPA